MKKDLLSFFTSVSEPQAAVIAGNAIDRSFRHINLQICQKKCQKRILRFASSLFQYLFVLHAGAPPELGMLNAYAKISPMAAAILIGFVYKEKKG